MLIKPSSIIISFLLIISFSISEASPALPKTEEPKNILILFSMDQGLVAYKMILESIKNVLRDEYSEPFKLYVEYFDLGRFPDSSYQQYLFNKYNDKYKNAKIDLLISVGPALIPLLEKYAESYIKNIPTVSLDLKDPFNKNKKYSLNSRTKEILLNIDAKTNFKLAFNLFPDYSNAYIISGSSRVDKFFHKITMHAALEYEKSKKIVDLSDLSMEELLKRVNQIPKKSIIFITTFAMDGNAVIYNTPEAIRLITKETSAPIFVLLDTPFEEGALGGYVGSMKNFGMVAARSAIKILNGENPPSVQVDETKLNQYMFDWRELKRFNLQDSDLIPNNSVILFEETDFIGTYKWIIGAGILFIILQSLLIINLIKTNKKQKVLTAQLIQSENRYRELVREDRLMQMGLLTASLAHEINQPLAAILSNAQAAVRYLDSDKNTQNIFREILGDIIEDDKRAAGVINSVRGMLKQEKRDKEIIELDTIFREVITIFNSEANERNISIDTKFENESVFILGDRIQLQQVILNLLINAANELDLVPVGTRVILIKTEVLNKFVIVSVTDSGPGIKEEVKQKLFEPFFTTRKDGLGIGLAVCRSIIEDHGGKIWAQNNTDIGATFSFQLKIIENA